jgi:hypothetical protein
MPTLDFFQKPEVGMSFIERAVKRTTDHHCSAERS